MGNTNNFYRPIKTLYDKFTIILCNRDHTQIGTVQNVDFSSIHLKAEMANGNEVSFDVYYELDGEKEPTWEDLVDFKLIYIPELKDYLEITVNDYDSVERKKSIVGVNAGIAELSQTQLYGLEINTDIDIEAWTEVYHEDYKGTIFYDNRDKRRSLLHRVLEKAPQYSIGYVPASVAAIERTFSVNDKSIWDFLSKDVAEAFDVIFLIDNEKKKINVYDLMVVCNECSTRQEPTYEYGYYDITAYAEDSDLKIAIDSDNAWLYGNDSIVAYKKLTCKECGSSDLDFFGEDTHLLINKDNLTDEIQLSIDTDSIKNTFKLEAGDDDMTATVVALNPNGSNYINMFNELDYADMPDRLVAKLGAYEDLYNSYKDEYAELMEDYYDALDNISKYKHTLMPPEEPQQEITAKNQAAKLTPDVLSPTGLSKLTSSTTINSVNNALEQLAKVYVKTGYVKVQIDMTEEPATFTYRGTYSDDKGEHNWGEWTGRFLVTNYSDSEDTAYSRRISVIVTDDYETYLNEKIAKNIVKYDDKEGDIYDVLKLMKDPIEFVHAITYYSVKRLESFESAISGCLNILVQEGHGTPTKKDPETGSDVVDEFYEDIYLPYWNNQNAVHDELVRRQSGKEPDGSISTRTDGYGEPYATANVDYWINILGYDPEVYGDQAIGEGSLEARKREIQSILDFKKYLGDEDYNIYCAYRREQTYSNPNYISVGLNNAEIFEKAQEYWEAANRELTKASTPQYTVKCNLYNLLPTDGYETFRDKLVLGNWLRVIADDQLFRLRLLSYSIDFNDFTTVDVEFSNVTKIGNIMTDIESILSSAKAMSSSYGYTANQASAGNNANNTIGKFVETGLMSALTNVKNNVDEEITFGEYGIYAKSLDDDGSYSPKQLRITHNILVFTDDNWQTAKAALGEHDYTYYDPSDDKYKITSGYGLTAEFVQAGHINGSTMIGGDIYSENYSVVGNTGTHLNLNDGTFNFGGDKFTYDGNRLTLKDGVLSAASITNGNNFVVTPEGKVTARDITLYGAVTSGGSVSGAEIIGGTFQSNNQKFTVDANGTMTCVDAVINGHINNGNGTFEVTTNGALTATSGNIGGWAINNNSLSGGNVTLNGSGDITCRINNDTKWAIYNNGNATFSNITATGGEFTNVIINGYIDVETFNAQNLVVGELLAQKATIEDLTAGTLTVQESINAQNAVIANNLDVNGTITVNQIQDSAGNIPTGRLLWQTIGVAKALNPDDKQYLWINFDSKQATISASQPGGSGWVQVKNSSGSPQGIVINVPTKNIFVLGINNVSS